MGEIRPSLVRHFRMLKGVVGVLPVFFDQTHNTQIPLSLGYWWAFEISPPLSDGKFANRCGSKSTQFGIIRGVRRSWHLTTTTRFSVLADFLALSLEGISLVLGTFLETTDYLGRLAQMIWLDAMRKRRFQTIRNRYGAPICKEEEKEKQLASNHAIPDE